MVNREFERRAGDGHDTLLENLQRVIDRRRSRKCEEEKLKVTPKMKKEMGSPQKLRLHVWDVDHNKGCVTCNSDQAYLIALVLRSLATSKYRNN